MAKYSTEFKSSIIGRMMPPQNQSVAEIARETGLKEVTLYKWKKEAKAQGFVAPGEQNSERWSTKDKFQVVVETASLTEVELAE